MPRWLPRSCVNIRKRLLKLTPNRSRKKYSESKGVSAIVVSKVPWEMLARKLLRPRRIHQRWENTAHGTRRSKNLTNMWDIFLSPIILVRSRRDRMPLAECIFALTPSGLSKTGPAKRCRLPNPSCRTVGPSARKLNQLGPMARSQTKTPPSLQNVTLLRHHKLAKSRRLKTNTMPQSRLFRPGWLPWEAGLKLSISSRDMAQANTIERAILLEVCSPRTKVQFVSEFSRTRSLLPSRHRTLILPWTSLMNPFCRPTLRSIRLYKSLAMGNRGSLTLQVKPVEDHPSKRRLAPHITALQANICAEEV